MIIFAFASESYKQKKVVKYEVLALVWFQLLASKIIISSLTLGEII